MCRVCLCNSFHGTRKLTQDSFPVNRTRIAYAVCTFCRFSERARYASPSFTANSIKALGAVLIGRLYFWSSSSLVLLPLSQGSAANVKLCDNRAIRHSTAFDPATGVHDGCEMIPSPPAQHDTLSTTQTHTLSPVSLSCLSSSPSLLPSRAPSLFTSASVTLQIDSVLYAVYLKPVP